MIDVQRLHSSTDAGAIIGRYVDLKRTGGESSGACPFCPCQAAGARHRCDRFRLFADGRWWCRRCQANGDVIEFVRRVEGVGFVAACELLGGRSTAGDTVSRPVHRTPSPVIEEALPPNGDWQTAAVQVVEHCEFALWSPAGASARSYLHRDRLLTDDTIRRYRLGYSERDQHIAGLFVKAGITIPHLGPQDEVWHVNVRRSPRAEGPKYWSIAGGAVLAFGVAQDRGNQHVALSEGEFDTMLLSQECTDLDVFTLGGASRRTTPTVLLPRLAFARRLLLVHDGDGDGQAAARELADRYGGAVVELPAGQDVTDVARAGASLSGLLAPYVSACAYCGGSVAAHGLGRALCQLHASAEVTARSSHIVDELLNAGAFLEAA